MDIYVGKIIDAFHLKNHKRKECHIKCNPQGHPHDFNTHCCEYADKFEAWNVIESKINFLSMHHL